MTHQSAASHAPAVADPGEQVAELRHVLELVERIAGLKERGSNDQALDEAARISAAYAEALPIAQRRFDLLAGEVTTWATSGIEALLVLQHRGQDPEAAAARLAEALAKALKRLAAILPS